MKHVGYYLIRPRDSLIQSIQDLSESGLSDVVDEVMWSGNEFDKGVLLPTDHELIVKLLFVDSVIREQSEEIGFDTVFNTLERSEESFDLNWSLTRIHVDMLVEEAVEDAVLSGSIPKLKNTNPRVEEFLSKVLSQLSNSSK
ncbi:MAG: hypothetical protein OQJ89_09320 [Kangiellaceae bacterium]|nr:hypothetical protein [Kangiellaceae bacterium]MCW9017152.1 hypothetical protein [Kangiellaceae bacterium]